MEHKAIEYEIAKELTLKAMEEGMLKVVPVEAEKPDVAGKKIAEFYNAVLQNLKL